MGMRSDVAMPELVLDLLAQYEPQLYLEHPDQEPQWYHLEQDVISQYLFEQAYGKWAAFNPGLVKHGDAMLYQFKKLKVLHVCASSTTHTNKLRSMHKSRRAYYGLSNICLTSA